MSSSTAHEDPKAHLVRLVKDFSYAMLITRNSSDQLRARPMRIAKADVEQNLWFMTTMGSTKVQELQNDPRACVTLQNKGKYISLSGTVHPSRDKGAIEAIWNEGFRPWFPQGQDTPDLILVKIDTTWAEFWDYGSGEKSTLDFISSTVKKLVGAQPDNPQLQEDHAKITLTAPTQK